MRRDQLPDGAILPFIPSEISKFSGPVPYLMRLVSLSVGWGDASVMIPWTLNRPYGDKLALADHYSSMCRWVDFPTRRAQNRSWTRRPPTKKPRANWKTTSSIPGTTGASGLRPSEGSFGSIRYIIFASGTVATAYPAHSAALLAEIASILGKQEDAQRYSYLADEARTAWRAAFLQADGRRIGDDKQDDY
ncbi:bacterial alpha-L-rhamnosidase [Aspergillus alliaceus]|uniref:bacterial alpha-L-rhamnosidase n=1 Tax=Petromyces alliaceus TaxID=209559 RepID=UPI0012A5D3B3|nr:bacterial alpha-L-rhamnosidase [Aspergillus alliaceus]KAB8231667.1 bacterial alpha-L-rhamnosidase [Aspergillus alliaceus]